MSSETGEVRQEKGDRRLRQETENGRQEMRGGRPETEEGRQKKVDRKRETGEGRQEK